LSFAVWFLGVVGATGLFRFSGSQASAWELGLESSSFHCCIKVSLSRRVVLKSVRGPTAAILSFASPKESIQRKGDPEFRLNPALLAFGEGFRKGYP